MQNAVPANSDPGHAPNWLISVLTMAMVLAANAALIVGLLHMLSWIECALLMVTGTALSGGVLFTLVTMRRLSAKD
jgi:hypothetical protein